MGSAGESVPKWHVGVEVPPCVLVGATETEAQRILMAAHKLIVACCAVDTKHNGYGSERCRILLGRLSEARTSVELVLRSEDFRSTPMVVYTMITETFFLIEWE